ncbi:hypothetical protein RISK_004997 [Rhodopirellula islandica]|uniref:Uncharacterized protein n=1 Tax=Rhodopirellula islandica TaxID=595434 RepID=A0A0J1B8H6_RHOIS|nr:hypothetical protein RISK_004997 [Rhodopirellula islandica]
MRDFYHSTASSIRLKSPLARHNGSEAPTVDEVTNHEARQTLSAVIGDALCMAVPIGSSPLTHCANDRQSLSKHVGSTSNPTQSSLRTRFHTQSFPETLCSPEETCCTPARHLELDR